MMTYSFFSRAKRYVSRHLFAFFYGKSFKEFGKSVSIIAPDIIEGASCIALEEGVSFNSGVWLLALKQGEREPQITIQEGATIGRCAHIVAVENILIEKNVLIADKVYISDNIHAYEDIDTPIMEQSILSKGKVVIGENSWIGENVSIIGASIGKHVVIGANAVVTKDIPDYSVAVGSPARVIRFYDTEKKQWVNR